MIKIENELKEFFQNFNSKDISQINCEKIIIIKQQAQSYRDYLNNQMLNMTREEIFNSLLRRFYKNDNLELKLFVTSQVNYSSINFNTVEEIFAFIVFVLDPNYEMANKYLSFVEQTNSNIKGLILHKQYAKKYNAFFDSKILQIELSLQLKELELAKLDDSNKKRTITG